MTIAIDASRAAGTQKTGIGWYCHHLLAYLKDAIPHDVRVVLYTDQALPEELRPWRSNWEERVLTRRGPMWSQLVLAHAVLRDQPDVFFVPAHVIPFALALAPRSRRPKLVTTIHDVVFREFPETYSPRERWYADHATRLAVRHADRIVVPTRHVARELERYYRCDPEKVAVIHHGVESRIMNKELWGNTTMSPSFMIPNSLFILYVGRLEHKKNVVRMVEAFTAIASRHPHVRLVLAGSPGYGHEEVMAAIARSPVADRIATPGWIDRAQYHQLLASSTVFLFPTLGEGFGLPIIEAFAAGAPVITSTGGAHEEVSGGAALLVSATDGRAIADALDRLLSDDRLRQNLVERGRHRAEEFTWDRSAARTWEALKSVLSP
ncbi:MAG: glycosyltransferase family 1 protein [bacterium]|nr:glycosyltransferase family 1 protein [bacterium]